MSLRKNQLKKMTLDQIMIHLSTQTDSQNIKLIHNFIADKNNILLDKRNLLINQISQTRKKILKNVQNLNGRVKDRIDKKQTIIMDKDSRPTTQTMTELMNLYSYLQSQNAIISRNNNSIKQMAQISFNLQQSLKNQIQIRLNFDDLDLQYQQLNAECMRQEAVRDALIKDRNEKRAHYANIQNSIQAYRVEYQKVEEAIRNRQRQLIRLSGYYQARISQDKAIIEQLPIKSLQYQQQILAAQTQLTACWATLNDRKMRQIEDSK